LSIPRPLFYWGLVLFVLSIGDEWGEWVGCCYFFCGWWRRNTNYGVNRDGNTVNPDARYINPDGNSVNPDARYINPDGNSVNPDARCMNPDGNSVNPDARCMNREAIITNWYAGILTWGGRFTKQPL